MSSAILSADDLNDFISPGVACIKPIETLPKTDDSNPYEVTTEDKVHAQNPAPASISLTDCLACSGCVTSAEAVLVSLQSHTEVLNTLDTYATFDISSHSHSGLTNIPSDAKIFVASVSPQVRASIAATFGISERRAGHIIEQFLSGVQGLRLGGKNNSYFNYVFDTNRIREVCLELGADEVAQSLTDPSRHKPIITSACPGWICYAEKTHPHILPHLSALKSPQALSGTLVKSVLSKTLGIHPAQIWHLAIMPCFDKKLEASREELTDQSWSERTDPTTDAPVRDVDCVITSRELLTLASSRDIVLANLPTIRIPSKLRQHFPDSVIADFLLSPSSSSNTQDLEAGTSGGYLYHILQSHQQLHPGSTVTTLHGRNSDMSEYVLTSTTGQPLLKCARYYGFRNIQNLVRKLKPPKAALPGATNRARKGVNGVSARGGGSDYAYVEVMACPGGCTNGGGQIKLEDVAAFLPETRGEKLIANARSLVSQKEWLARVDEAYFSADTESETDHEDDNEDVNMQNGYVNGGSQQRSPVHSLGTERIHRTLQHWSQLVDIQLSQLCYTTYRKVDSDVGKRKNFGDTERIAAIAGLSGGGW